MILKIKKKLIWLDLGRGSRSEELDQDSGHVVAPDAFLGVFSEQKIKEILHELLVFLVGLEIGLDNIYESLAVIYVSLPNSVAPHENELVAILSIKFPNIGFTGYHLLVIRQL